MPYYASGSQPVSIFTLRRATKACTPSSRPLILRVRKLNESRTPSRPYATATNTLAKPQSKETTEKEAPHPRYRALTLLHKTSSLIPRILPRKEHISEPLASLEFWNDILNAAYDDLASSPALTNARIVVYGVDKFSGARDLVTALLEEPFVSNEMQNDVLRSRGDRGEEHGKVLTIVYNGEPGQQTLRIQSPYLAQFSIPLQITELDATKTPTSPECKALDENSKALLFKADIPIILINPITTPLSDIFKVPAPLYNRHAIVIINSSSTSSDISAYITSSISHRMSKSYPSKPTVLVIDPARAIEALRNLKPEISSPTSIQRYQDNFLGSRISSLNDALKAVFDQCNGNAADPITTSSNLRTRTAIAHIRGVLLACGGSLAQAKEEFHAAFAVASDLSERSHILKDSVQLDVLGIPRQQPKDLETSPNLDEVRTALEYAKKEIQVTFDKLSWWRMVWRIDEIGFSVNEVVERVWCISLEKNLILHTGRLLVSQHDLTTYTLSRLSTLAAADSPFQSPVLLNKLSQITSSPSYHLSISSLTKPMHIRKQQLQFPTTRLHIAGQRAVMGMGTSAAAGVGIGWAGWMGWLVASGEGVFGFVGMEPGTAVGVGMLCVTLSVRWSVGKWEKAKKNWWEDWKRVGDALGRDLQTTIDRTMKDQVWIVADTACQKLEELAKNRKIEVEELSEELETLNEELQELERQFDETSNPA